MLARLRPWVSNRPPSLAIQSLLVAIFLVVSAFPDVVFLGRSISMVDSYASTISTPPPTPLYPEAKHRAPYHGFTDTGGAVWQSEPMIQFMRQVLTTGESPYWNPYSATGALGPETLVDQKFSPLTVLTALAGGGIRAFHAVVIGLYVAAVAFLFGALRRFVGISFLAGVAAAVVYLLNGFHIANLNSNVVQVYLYVPACLFALLAFGSRPSTVRLLAVFAAHIPVFLTTFMPTTVMAMIGTYGLAISHLAGLTAGQEMRKRLKAGALMLGLQVGAGILAILLLAPLYLPILESLKTIGTVDAYSLRVFYPVTINNLIGAFSPKHLFESYNAINPALWNPNTGGYIGNVAFHFGIVGMMLVAGACMARQADAVIRHVSIGIAALLILAFGRLYAVPGFGAFVETIPLVRSIGAQYWWMLIAVLVPVGAGLGFEALLTGRHRPVASTATAIVVLTATVILAFNYTPVRRVPYVLLCLLVMGFLLVAALRLTARVSTSTGSKQASAAALLILLAFFEYSFYMNHQRFPRSERVLTPPPEVAFLRDHIGQSRFANFGYAGLPPEWGSMYLLSQIESLNMNVLPDYLSFFQRNFLSDRSARWGEFPTLHHAKDNDDFNFAALDLLAVRYLLIPTGGMPARLKSLDPEKFPRKFESPAVTIVENPTALPRAYLVPALVHSATTPGEKGLWARNVAFSEDEGLLKRAADSGVETFAAIPNTGQVIARTPNIPDAAVKLEAIENSIIKARIETNRPAVFVLSDAWYPNWRAVANGKEVYVGRVNEAFRGVVVGAGVTQLELRYEPRTLFAARALSWLILGFILLLLAGRSRIDRFVNKLCPTIGPPETSQQ